MTITKYVLPVVAGAMSGVVMITLGEKVVHYIYPLQAGIDWNNKDAIAAAIRQMPVNAFILLLVNYAICSFLAGLIATVVAGRITGRPAIAVGIALTLAGLFNITMIPQPMWFCVISLFCYLPFAYTGYVSVRKKQLG